MAGIKCAVRTHPDEASDIKHLREAHNSDEFL